MDKIGKYLILGKLGEGGMGVVYKALDPLLDRVVALKTIATHLDAEPELRAIFFREGRSAAQLSHKNIITVYDLGEDGGQAYMALEFLEGEDLKEKIRKRESLPLASKLKIITEICEGLAHAHHRQVIHHDVKPANIFLTRSGQVKILDFGLARLMSGETTRSGTLRGSPNYMSPEQVRGVGTDCRTDIFSAGGLFYEFLTFRKAFDGDLITATIGQILYHDPEPPDRIDPAIDAGLSAIVMKCLAKDPDSRYQSLDGVLADLKALEEGAGSTVAATAPGEAPSRSAPPAAGNASDAEAQPAEPSGGGLRRRPRPAVRYAAAAIVLLAAAAVFAWKIMQVESSGNVGEEQASLRASPPESRSPVPPSGVSPERPALLQQEDTAGATSGRRVDGEKSDTQPGQSQVQEGKQDIVARENEQARVAIRQGRYAEASAGLKRALQIAPSNSEARRLTKDLAVAERQNADQAQERLAESKRRADEAKANEFAAQSYEAALRLEQEAGSRYAAQRYGEAAAAFFEASGLFRSAALEAESERKSRENQALQQEMARRRSLQREQALSSRISFEKEHVEAAKAGAEGRAPSTYQEAVRLSLEARSKWEQEDFAAAGTLYEAAAQAMRKAKEGAEASLKNERTPSETTTQPKPPVPTPAPPSLEDDQAAILAVLRQYSEALQSRDIKLLRTIWPGLTGSQEQALAQDFSNARQIEVRFAEVQTTVTGDAAVVRARRTYLLESVDGQRPRIETRMTMSLRRSGKSWLIETIRFEPSRRPNPAGLGWG